MSTAPIPPVPPIVPGNDTDDPRLPDEVRPSEEQQEADQDEDPNEQLPRE
jgi:hypothetical protein